VGKAPLWGAFLLFTAFRTAVALKMLQSYSFPGNVRELESIIKKAVVLSHGELLDQNLSESLAQAREVKPLLAQVSRWALSLKEELGKVEKALLRDAMLKCANTRDMAVLLSISQASVVRKMKRYGLNRLLNHK